MIFWYLQAVRVIQGQIVHLIKKRILLNGTVLEIAVHVVEQVVVGEFGFGGTKADLPVLEYLG